MLTLAQMYHPITASPFQNDEAYCEIAPCDALKPYIRCFWGTKAPISSTKYSVAEGLVIPDTCMDIIFDIDYTENSYGHCFCAIDEHSFRSTGNKSENLTATFAIRFYAWSAILFTEQDLSGTKNKVFCVEAFFEKIKRELEPILFDVPTLQGKIAIAEMLLLQKLHVGRINNRLLNAIYYMIDSCGRAKISDICNYATISGKQLERIFNYNMGISPKAFSSLIRYQLLWQDIVLSGNFQVLDAVDKYGYTDQSHLLNDFKRRHLMTPKEAHIFSQKDRNMSIFYNT